MDEEIISEYGFPVTLSRTCPKIVKAIFEYVDLSFVVNTFDLVVANQIASAKSVRDIPQKTKCKGNDLETRINYLASSTGGNP